MNNPGIVLCTRLKSRRIPNKALQEINGKPIIKLLVERLLRGDIPVCVAVPNDKEDMPIVDAVNGVNVSIHWGSRENVLKRFATAAQAHNFDPVIRVTNDDILIDTDMLDDMLREYYASDCDYMYVKKCIEGAGAEIISFKLVDEAYNNYLDDKDSIEHLSYPFRKYAKCVKEYIPIDGMDYGNVRLTIDYPEDLQVMRCIYNTIGHEDFSIEKLKIYTNGVFKPLFSFNQLPKISVYTCVYNAGATIERTIKSVLNQNYGYYEYIIVDDGSDDNTRELLWKYNNHPKITIVANDKNIGLAASSNKALSMAKGGYYVRVDADDQLTDPSSLGKMYHEIEKDSSIAICYSNYNIPVSNFVKGQWEISYVHTQNSDHHIGCAIIRARAFHEIKFTDKLKHWDGYDFYLRSKDRFKMHCIQEPLWIYHQSPDSHSNSDPEEREKIKKQIEVGIDFGKGEDRTVIQKYKLIGDKKVSLGEIKND